MCPPHSGSPCHPILPTWVRTQSGLRQPRGQGSTPTDLEGASRWPNHSRARLRAEETPQDWCGDARPAHSPLEPFPEAAAREGAQRVTWTVSFLCAKKQTRDTRPCERFLSRPACRQGLSSTHICFLRFLPPGSETHNSRVSSVTCLSYK